MLVASVICRVLMSVIAIVKLSTMASNLKDLHLPLESKRKIESLLSPRPNLSSIFGLTQVKKKKQVGGEKEKLNKLPPIYHRPDCQW